MGLYKIDCIYNVLLQYYVSEVENVDRHTRQKYAHVVNIIEHNIKCCLAS